ncbi:carbonic anhydrase [Legionella busanensis]|uniref:Carbonic anhydrase n=1 Tax=Legionella busanensis TaxID=190655 RepID=A0A378KAL1_9GAMM|nr:carbonic anhydrase family protein [Legionella busanensis]STX81370.1 carbonic anhydrase [Legionella busanensis]
MRIKNGFKVSAVSAFISLLSLSTIAQSSLHTDVMTAERQGAKTPDAVLQRLKEGNDRFVSRKLKNRDLLAQANATSVAQYPVAIVLNCMDARTPPEIVFDQGIGDIFAIRIGGNIQNSDILGSMEFGTQLMGAKLIAVIGHASCGAIRGACQEVQLGHLTALLNKIHPAVIQASRNNKTKDCSNSHFVDQIAEYNVRLVMNQIQTQSPLLSKLIKEGKIKVVGGMQDITTGKVNFFN